MLSRHLDRLARLVPTRQIDEMIALYFCLALVLYAALAVVFLKTLRRWRLRIPALIAALLIPSWDIIAQWVASSDICHEIDPVLSEEPRRVDGFASTINTLSFARELVADREFAFVEIIAKDSSITRVELSQDGSLEETRPAQTASRFVVDVKVIERPHGIVEIVEFVTDRTTGTPIAEQRRFLLAPTWLYRAVFGDLARNTQACTGIPDNHIRLVSQFLLPMEQE